LRKGFINCNSIYQSHQDARHSRAVNSVPTEVGVDQQRLFRFVTLRIETHDIYRSPVAALTALVSETLQVFFLTSINSANNRQTTET